MTKYTQREWNRVVGYGKVPKEYSHTVPSSHTDGKNTQRSNPYREKVYRTFKKIQEFTRKYGW